MSSRGNKRYEEYMALENEHEPEWEKLQIKAFTAWCNSHLRKAGINIDNIVEDFRSGIYVILLLELLSGKHLPRAERRKMRVHEIANVNKALEFIESQGVRLFPIGAEDIVDGNVKMTLGMIWTIIKKFAIQIISVEGKTAEDGLLLWCQRKTERYNNVNVTNFQTSLKDGMVWCALIHRHRPELIDYHTLSRDNPTENLNTAFDVAEKHLYIPRMVDAEDIINSATSDERSEMTYLSAYYHNLSGDRQLEIAANRNYEVLKVNRENERLMEEYERLASDLLEWIRRTKLWLENRTTDNTLPGIRRKLDELSDYRREEKPLRLGNMARLKTTFNALQSRLRSSSRPAYLPTEGKMVPDIANAWKGLKLMEKEVEGLLSNKLLQFEKLEHLAKKFNNKCDMYEEWSTGNEDMWRMEDFKRCHFTDIIVMKRYLEVFESDLAAHQDRVEQIEAITQELNTLEYHDIVNVNTRCQTTHEQWDLLVSLTQARRTALDEAEPILERIDSLQLKFAKRAAPFNNWLDGAKEDLEDMFIVHTTEEIQGLIDAYEQFKSTLGEADREYKGIIGLCTEADQLATQYGLLNENPYTTLQGEAISAKWEDLLQELVSTRDQILNDEMPKQQKANVVGKHPVSPTGVFKSVPQESSNQIPIQACSSQRPIQERSRQPTEVFKPVCEEKSQF